MPRKITTAVVAAPVTLTPEQRAAAQALIRREAIVARADAASDSVVAVADGLRDYAGATAAAGAVGLRCTGVFLKRLMFGAPKARSVPVAVIRDDAELAACLKRHGLL
jgi:hypothetical protein